MIPSPSDVPGIVILTHGNVGQELIKGAEMIIGRMENVTAISLLPGQSPEDFLAQVQQVLSEMPPESLILTDLFGGTPSNMAAMLAQNHSVSIVSGVNLGMLIQAVESRESHQGEALAESVTAAGRDAIRNVLAMFKQIS